MTRKSSGVGVQHAIPIAIGLACGIYAFSVAVPRLVTQLTGVEGSFHAERCTWELDSEGEAQWECEGSFTASDGSFTIRRIEAAGVFDSRPEEPVARLVDGPSADKAVPPDMATSLVPMGMGLTAFVFPAWALNAATRDAAERRRRRRAWPAAADLPPNFGPVRIPPAGSAAGSAAAVGSEPPAGTTPKHHS
ncbi:hypothetical protein [Streptomyces virginiae]|uniref:hypothetical protein n=1 Tax=Streptomyces virginiae TaxID=1961 RepID=UPI002259CF8C|nr:hypothetical protein [Streptomyces virginiae]MCX4958653.1 hypothetical protein [Streptomyces virginiae]